MENKRRESGRIVALTAIGIISWVIPMILFLFIYMVSSLFTLPAILFSPQPNTPPLDLAEFDAGYLISDEIFYNSETLNVEQIQNFLAKVGQGCQSNSEGTACLSEYKEDTLTFPATRFCPQEFLGETGDNAASIIHKVALACRINPQVLLVTLQKEQGLLTATGASLTPDRYKKAMGYGCPDMAKCDETYGGFFKQLYFAAQQFQRYRIEEKQISG